MSDSDDTPPPIPSSPPPPPLEDSEPVKPRKRRESSEQFKALQKLIGESVGMYTSPSSSAPPPNKKPSLEDELGESPKLVHVTKSRPKRKVRPPSRSSVRENAGEKLKVNSPPVEEHMVDSVFLEKTNTEETELPPPFPSSAPPDAPPEPPPLDSPPPDADTPKDKPLLRSTWLETKPSTVQTVEKPSQVTSVSPTNEGSRFTSDPPAPTKAIVISSFSDRLKKLRERRAAKSVSNSSLSPSTPTITQSSDAASSTVDSKPVFNASTTYNRYQDDGSENCLANDTPVSVNVEPLDVLELREKEGEDNEPDDDDLPPAVPPPIPDLPPPSDELESELDQDEEEVSTLSSNIINRPVTVMAKVSFRTLQKKDEWKKKREQLQLDSFKSDGLPLLGSSNTPPRAVPANVPGIHSEQSLTSALPQSSFHNVQQDSIEMDTISSTESLPSLPDSFPPALPDTPPPNLSSTPPPMLPSTPPPTLPDAPPPSLPSGPPPVSPVIDTATIFPRNDNVFNLHTPGSSGSSRGSTSVGESAELPQTLVSPPSFTSLETSTPKSSSDIELRHKKSPPSQEASLNRMSAFDALVHVEPTAEDKKQPKLSLEEQRKLTIMAARYSNADVEAAQSVWSKQAESVRAEDKTPVSTTSEQNESADENEQSHSLASLDTTPPGSTSNSKPPCVAAQPSELTLSGTEQATARAALKREPAIVSQDSTPGSSSENVSTKQQLRHSLPPGSSAFQQIRVISEGTPPSSPDLRFTRVAKEKWWISPKSRPKQIQDDLSASVSTGNILDAPTGKKKKKRKHADLQKTSSLQSFGSSSESLKTGFSLPWSKLKKGSSKKSNPLHPISPLAAASVATPPLDAPRSPSALSLGSDDSSHGTTPPRLSWDSSQEVHKRQPKPKGPSKFVFPSTPSTDHGSKGHLSIGSKENLLSAQFPGRDQQHEELVEQQLAKVKEQSKMTLELLRKDRLALVRSLTPMGSPLSLRPASMILGTDIYKIDPSQWTVDQVCKWLELVGLGSFREIFKESNVNGKRLLQLDIQLFDELGIDSPEIREIFLAKIYELSNPSSAMEGLEDDFRLSVEDYTSEDWKKFEAALNALKSPVLDDTIELEPSAIGQLIHTKHVRSQSTPNITELGLDQETSEGDQFSPESRIMPSKTVHSFRNYLSGSNQTGQDSVASQHYTIDPRDADGDRLTMEWVAGLPGGNTRGRKRALTEPSLPHNMEASLPTRMSATTLPRQSQLAPNVEVNDEAKQQLIKKKSLTPRQISIQEEPPMHSVETNRSQSYTTTIPDQSLVKLFMNTVQEGALYKSFLITPTTTTEELIAMALEKAYLGEGYNPQHYSIWDRDTDKTSRSSPSRQLQQRECPVVVQSYWPQDHSHYFELRLKEGIQLHPTPQKRKESAVSDTKTLETRIESLTQEKNNLLKELDLYYSELQDKKKLEQQLKAISKELDSVKTQLMSGKVNHTRAISEMTDKMEQLNFEKTQLEDRLSVVNTGDGSSSILTEIQSKYTGTVDSLRRELTERDRQLEDMAMKQTSLEGELTGHRQTARELQTVSRLLREHQEQLRTVEQQLAEKEETIHSLRADIEQSHVSAKHALTIHKTLQAVESTSKQQQELSNQTARELREQLSRVTTELARKEQQVLSLKKERDRLTRERQAKDNIVTSLEADLASYKALQSSHMNEGERILTMQRSLSVHEVALASVRSEYNQQTADLAEAEGEVSKLRDALAKKEEQLTLLSSSQEHHSRSSLHPLLDNNTPHQLVLAEVKQGHLLDKEGGEKRAGVERSLSQRYGIKVSGLLGNCVVSEVSEEAEAAGIHAGDRLLEIDGTSVVGMTQREINLVFKKRSRDAPLKVVAARPLEAGSHDLARLDSTDEVLIERYKKLNASLNSQLDSQTTEVDRWRKECERLKADLLKYSSLEKDRRSEHAFLESNVRDLKSQLEESEKIRVQLRETLDNVTGMEERERELISLMEAAERASNERLKKLEAEHKQAMALLRGQLVSGGDFPSPAEHPTPELTGATHSELLAHLTETQEECARHKAYLDQLLAIVVEKNPDLLSQVGEAQRMRDQMSEADAYGDSWC